MTARDHARGSAHQRGYTSTWATYSRAWLARFPFCGTRADGVRYPDHSRCVQQGLDVLATCTDHIVAIKFGGSVFEPANHQSLCAGCNARKAIAFEGGFGR